MMCAFQGLHPGTGDMENSAIENLIRICWTKASGVDISSGDERDLQQKDELYTASVIFTRGTHDGSLSLALAEPLARMVSAHMFQKPQAEVSLDDIQDCLKELVNVLAGNIKVNFFGDSELSRPTISFGNDALLSLFKIDAIFQKRFLAVGGEEFIIQVCQTT